ncbi:hypothetical protein EV182_008919, partial [Spiromyces aspiralis]
MSNANDKIEADASNIMAAIHMEGGEGQQQEMDIEIPEASKPSNSSEGIGPKVHSTKLFADQLQRATAQNQQQTQD